MECNSMYVQGTVIYVAMYRDMKEVMYTVCKSKVYIADFKKDIHLGVQKVKHQQYIKPLYHSSCK